MHSHRAPIRIRATPRWWVALATVGLLLAYGLGTANADTAPAPDPVAAQYARCQADLKAKPAPSGSYLTWLNNCLKAFAPAAPSPSPSPSGSPSSNPTGTPTPPSPTTASPTPSSTPTTPPPSPTPEPTTASPTPSPTPAPTDTGWPGPDNTGVPSGQTLLPWPGCPTNGGDATISAPVHLDSVVINCDVAVRTSGVVITRSRINGSIGDGEPQNCAGCSFSLDQVEVAAGAEQNPAVWHTTITVTRSNIHGGQTSVGCVEACTVKDSWLHGQVISVAGQHLGGFLSNGGGSQATPSLIQHNTIACDPPQQGSGDSAASCSGAINLFGDFAAVRYYTFDHNFIHAAVDSTGSPTMSYCIYGGEGDGNPPKPFPHADHIVFTGNIIENGPDRVLPDGADPTRHGTFPGWCGWWAYGISSFNTTAAGNVWSGNFWSDGAPARADGTPPA